MMLIRTKEKQGNLSPENEKATKRNAGWPTWKWFRRAIALALSIFTSTVYVVRVESWPAVSITQETHFSFDSKTTIKVGGDK